MGIPIPLPTRCDSLEATPDFPKDIVTKTEFDSLGSRMVVRTRYDNSAVMRANAAERMERTGRSKYTKASQVAGMTHVARIHMGDIERLRALGYNLLSSDPDETRRALTYLQAEESGHLLVDGKPFAKKRPKWE